MRKALQVYAARFRRMWPTILVVALATTGIATLAQLGDMLGIRDSEIGAYDSGLTELTRAIAKPERSNDVVILAIDDLTFQKVSENPGYAMNFGSWPYSRNLWARVFEHLKKEGAKAIVFDAVIDERHSDPTGDLAMGQIVEELDVPLYVGFSVNAGAADLPKVVAKNRPLVSGTAAKASVAPAPGGGEETFEESFEESFEEDDGYPQATAEEVAESLAFPVRSEIGLPTITDEEGRVQKPVPPIAPLIPAVKGFGLVDMEEDGDGRMRRTRFAYTDGVNTYVTLSVALAADLFGADEVAISHRKLTIGNRVIPINPDGTAEIDYGGTLDQRFRAVSLIHVIDDWAYEQEKKAKSEEILKAEGKTRRLDPGYFKDKVVIIGGFAVGTADVKGTPFTTASPGVVKHAAEIQNLLDGRFIVEAPFSISVLLTFLVAFSAFTIIVLIKWPPLEIGFPFLLFYFFFYVTGLVLVREKLHVLSAMPAWAASFASVLAAIYNNFLASKERARLKEAFANSIDGHDLSLMVEDPKLPTLAGEFREITVLVTDIRDFSAISAKYSKEPQTLAAFLNMYLTKVTAILTSHGGCIDKYVGDSVICLFGAPLRQADHATRAAEAALAITEEMKRWKETLPADVQNHVNTRIGVNSGEMFVGNFGSEQLVDYTAMGDGMTLALAIERVNEDHGTKILVGEATHALTAPYFEFREFPPMKLVDGLPSQKLFELRGPKREGATAPRPAAKRASG